MNCLKTDLFRAVFSKRFLIGVLLSVLALCDSGTGGELFRMSIPLVCTFPYACGWLDEYKYGFVKFSLSRGGVRGYIFGKFFACGIAGGLVEVTGIWIYGLAKVAAASPNYALLFFSGVLWASVAATLAALSNSKYVAYGGSFVIYYFLIILHDRYWDGLSCLSPWEWVFPTHAWPLGKAGILLLLAGLITITGTAYYFVLQRRLAHV